MRLCPGCRRENANDARRCGCGYSLSLRDERSWRGFLFRLLQPLLWMIIVAAVGLVGYQYGRASFGGNGWGKATQNKVPSPDSWITQEFSGVVVDVPVYLKPSSKADALNPEFASLYTDVANDSGSAGDTEITVSSMVEASSELPDLAVSAVFAAKAFARQPYVNRESHTIQDWQRGELTGELLRLQAHVQTQDLSMQVLFLKRESRRWTVCVSYHPSSGSAVADRIMASVRPKQ